MTDTCGNCGAEITQGGIFKAANERYGSRQTAILNFVTGSEYTEICESCGKEASTAAVRSLRDGLEESQKYIKENIIDFPMMTITQLPPLAKCRIQSMVTANVTVGTGFFSELSQGFSDFFGVTNVASGMALKVNSGEAKAREIIVAKAIALGANCVVAVDVDYGTTANNAATVNMQGTAVAIENLDEILDASAFEKYAQIQANIDHMKEMARWLEGDYAASQ